MRKAMLLGIVLILGSIAVAQDYPAMELGLNYTYARYSPSAAYIKNSYSLNGGGGSIVYNFSRYIGAKMDLQGYGSNSSSFTIPSGIGPCPADGPTCTGNVQANLFTYMFGPQVGIRSGKFRPFGHVLLGGAHSNLGANLYKQTGTTIARPAGDAFGLSFGGGIDIPLNHSGTVAFRPAEVDYLWTHFNLYSGQSGQSNFQYKAGIVFNFGGGSR